MVRSEPTLRPHVAMLRRARIQITPTVLKQSTKALTITEVRAARPETAAIAADLAIHGIPLTPPQTRGECPPFRPCPYVACRYHMWQDPTPTGSIKLNFAGLEPWQMSHSCALDVCDEHPEGLTLEETGTYFNLTRERIRQIEGEALEKIREALGLSEEDVRRMMDAIKKQYDKGIP